MTTLIIPAQTIPNQTFFIDLNGQECEIHLYTRYGYLYLDLTVEDTPIIQGQICLNNVDLIQYKHLKFEGQLKFVDTQGNEDPYYSGLNERWLLTYVF